MKADADKNKDGWTRLKVEAMQANLDAQKKQKADENKKRKLEIWGRVL